MKTLAIVLVGGLLSTVGASLVAAPEQGPRPGDMSPANVWVQNRGGSEAIPVSVPDDVAPLRVQVAAAAPLRIDGIVATRPSRQAWEYAEIRIGVNQDAAATLNGAGADGWESTGVVLPTKGGVLVILKRPR